MSVPFMNCSAEVEVKEKSVLQASNIGVPY